VVACPQAVAAASSPPILLIINGDEDIAATVLAKA
jgi:hypothetical protein